MHNHDRMTRYVMANLDMPELRARFLLDLAVEAGTEHLLLTPAQRRRVRHKTGQAHKPVPRPEPLPAFTDELASVNWSVGPAALRTPSVLSRDAAREALVRAREAATPRRRRV